MSSLTRTFQRNIARERLTAMGVSNVNRHMGFGIRKSVERRNQRTRRGLLHIFRRNAAAIPPWRSVLCGKAAKEGFNAQMRAGYERITHVAEKRRRRAVSALQEIRSRRNARCAGI